MLEVKILAIFDGGVVSGGGGERGFLGVGHVLFLYLGAYCMCVFILRKFIELYT